MNFQPLTFKSITVNLSKTFESITCWPSGQLLLLIRFFG
nr:MAG TPA: hypothetical protein [Caudoviricetes sp.]